MDNTAIQTGGTILEENEEQEVESGFKYEVGEQVKVLDLPDYQYPRNAGVYWVSDMNYLKGQVITITHREKTLGGVRYLTDASWYLAESWLRPVEAKTIEKDETKKFEIKLEAEVPTTEQIREMINLVDRNILLKLFRARLKEQGHLHEAGELTKTKINKYLKKWATSKYRFYKLFGNKLTISIEKELEKDDKFFSDSVENIKQKYPLFTRLFDGIATADIKENKITRRSDQRYLDHPKVQEGMKITRVLALLNNNDLNMDFSKIYQDKNTKKIIISIDPVDFLTVSINKSWRSCHNFINGEWRNAGLSLMQDKTSMVAYTSSGDVEYNFNGEKIKWNNKNWRQMIYLSETNSQIICSLQYPYYSDILTKTARVLLEDTLSKYLNIANKWKVSDSFLGEVYCTDNMYNDIGRSGCKYIINKYDINTNFSIATGSRFKGLTHNYYIEEGDEDL